MPLGVSQGTGIYLYNSNGSTTSTRYSAQYTHPTSTSGYQRTYRGYFFGSNTFSSSINNTGSTITQVGASGFQNQADDYSWDSITYPASISQPPTQGSIGSDSVGSLRYNTGSMFHVNLGTGIAINSVPGDATITFELLDNGQSASLPFANYYQAGTQIHARFIATTGASLTGSVIAHWTSMIGYAGDAEGVKITATAPCDSAWFSSGTANCLGVILSVGVETYPIQLGIHSMSWSTSTDTFIVENQIAFGDVGISFPKVDGSGLLKSEELRRASVIGTSTFTASAANFVNVANSYNYPPTGLPSGEVWDGTATGSFYSQVNGSNAWGSIGWPIPHNHVRNASNHQTIQLGYTANTGAGAVAYRDFWMLGNNIS